MKDCLSPSTSAANGSARGDLAGSILVPPVLALAAVIMIGPRMREDCLSKMALSFSSALPRTKRDSPVATSQWESVWRKATYCLVFIDTMLDEVLEVISPGIYHRGIELPSVT